MGLFNNAFASNSPVKSVCSSDKSDPHYLKTTMVDKENIRIEICAHGTNECVQIGQREIYPFSVLRHGIFTMKNTNEFGMQGLLMGEGLVVLPTAALLLLNPVTGLAELGGAVILVAGTAANAMGFIYLNEDVDHANAVYDFSNGDEYSDESNACKVAKFPYRTEVTAKHLGAMMDKIVEEKEESVAKRARSIQETYERNHRILNK